jgi:hypothetical protein
MNSNVNSEHPIIISRKPPKHQGVGKESKEEMHLHWPSQALENT